MRSNVVYCMSILTILFSYVILGYIAVLMFYPVKSFQVMKPILPTFEKHYHPGEIIKYVVTSCRFNDNPGSVERVIRNVDDPSIAFSVPLVPLIALPNRCGDYNISVPLPLSTVKGRYKVENRITIRTNAIRNEYYYSESEIFDVKKLDLQILEK